MTEGAIFRTEDGVYICDGDQYFSVFIGGGTMWIINCCKAYKETLDHHELRADYKLFSRKESAEEYVLMNKPCLSASDIVANFQLGGANIFRLKQLAKSKL